MLPFRRLRIRLRLLFGGWRRRGPRTPWGISRIEEDDVVFLRFRFFIIFGMANLFKKKTTEELSETTVESTRKEMLKDKDENFKV